MGFMFEFLEFVCFLVGVGMSISVVLGIPLHVLMLIYRSGKVGGNGDWK